MSEASTGLLNESKNKSNKYEGSAWSQHWKLILTGVGVVFLIALGVIFGVILNTDRENKLKNSKREELFPYSNIRLPLNVIPERYKIYLHPNITDNKFGFTGTVRILINITEETDSVLLHIKDLNISEVKCYHGSSAMSKHKGPEDSQQVPVKDHLISVEHEFLMIRMKEQHELEVGKQYTLFIRFNGRLSNGLEGFYKSSYTTSKGEKRYLATTHFEATQARAAFPCFDEPALKALFEIIMVREPQHTALSNMPIVKTINRTDGLKEDHFQQSLMMSTYLVAFVVCDYGYKSAKTSRGIEVKVWAPKEQIEQANFAIYAAPKVLDYYETFFQVNFPLPKQDLIAIPDFAAGAMENWGLITYRLTSILYDEKESSSANKQWVAVVIAHELAHQWFGNLVTMKWWNDLWLNEGFAAFVEFIGANITEPSWQMMDQFIVDDTQNSLTLDSSSNSHPISVTVNDPAQINEIFDTISYDKGASIIRMMKNFLGSDVFHTGLTDYLNKYKFKNAVSDDLWACLTKAANNTIDVKSVMDTWTLQMGYPLITITKNHEQSEKGLVTQEHFLIDVDRKTAASPFNYKWDVPITFYFEHKKEKQLVWFNRSADSINIPMMNASGWIKANIDQLNFYRVNYDEDNWNLLSKQLQDNHKAFSTSDRSNLIDDAFELAKAGKLDQIKALEMTAYLKNEDEYVPWITALGSLGYIGGLLQGRSCYSSYQKYIIQQVKPIVDKLGWSDEGTHLNRYLRGAALRSSVMHNDTDSVKRALEIFDRFMNNHESVAPNLRSTVYLAGIKYGGKEQWEFMLNKYLNSPFPSEQRKIMFALADSSDESILKKYLSWSMNTSIIRTQDTCGVIEHISTNIKGTKMAEDFVIKNWEKLFERYGKGSFDMSSLIKTVFARMKTKEDLKKAKKFLESHKLGSGSLAAKQSINAISNHIHWLEKNEKKVCEWLKNKIQSGSSEQD
ncbi:endoplasmic reticulum aminopeptidase 1 isoform X2 [Hydra vulgaris]|uniref:Aminopeptidase n=1 Tax=Hydra vulgaris TaxID=6087 RepID=T2M4D3_HYDVU|nr:endoplasmic reticulum aminopeptidase 1 isoform X2 [Hydra vulgaris]